MIEQVLVEQFLNTWKINNGINLYLIGEIPTAGFKAIPAGSKGRTVAEQLFHISHESHHRGQIMLALSKTGCACRSVSVQGLWGKWMWGK